MTFVPETLASHPISQKTDFSLVSSKNFSEILPSNGLGPGPDDVGQKGLILLHLRRHSQKITSPPNFFSLETTRLAELFEGLNGFLVQTPGELCSSKTRDNCLFCLKLPAAKVL